MSEYGLKIKIYQAGSIYEVDRGVRFTYDSRDAMLSNSLFLDFIKDNGLQIHKNESTRDIICIEFKYGASSYEDAVAKLKRKLTETSHKEAYEKRIAQLAELKSNFKKCSKEDLRIHFYEQGINIKYPVYTDKKITGYHTIHYKMLYRTPGKAKKGSVMFIRDELYETARNFLYMGYQLPEQNAPIVEIGAYSSLITSTIEHRIHIPVESILILNDYKSFCRTDVVSIETDENKHCYAVPRSNYEVSNTMFDGQALIDESIFPDYANGYILLRHHFTKMAAFCTRIQLFFQDYFGEDYELATLTDCFGNKHLAKDIKLITTTEAVKWMKFDGISFEYWCNWVRANNSTWGVVKTAHPSKLGPVQRMSYQMVNSLTPDIMKEVMNDSTEYVMDLKLNDDSFINYLRRNRNFSNDFDALVALCEQDPEFIRTDYYRDRKKHIIATYVENLKLGRLIQNADNLVIVGSPYAMLLHAVGEDPESDPTFNVEDKAIQVYTERFEDGEYLAAFRSPFNSQNNLDYLHNIRHKFLSKYFNLGKLIIAVNMCHTDFQDRNNGSDMDSDSIYTTDQKQIVEHARETVRLYHTIVNNIPKEKNSYSSSMADFALVDNNLAHSQRTIGESSNLAQLCLTYGYNFTDPKYKDYACVLAVVA